MLVNWNRIPVKLTVLLADPSTLLKEDGIIAGASKQGVGFLYTKLNDPLGALRLPRYCKSYCTLRALLSTTTKLFIRSLEKLPTIRLILPTTLFANYSIVLMPVKNVVCFKLVAPLSNILAKLPVAHSIILTLFSISTV